MSNQDDDDNRCVNRMCCCFNSTFPLILTHTTKKIVFLHFAKDWLMKTTSLSVVILLSTSDNYQFLKGMKNLVASSGYKLKICHEYMNRGDRWMQVRKCKGCI